MYALDVNINEAIEQQAKQARALNAFSATPAAYQRAALSDSGARPASLAGKAALALAAPFALLLAWVLLAR